ncbi:MAG: ATP-binding cassette domain-containing protein, partial [Planctomycetota bacterium]
MARKSVHPEDGILVTRHLTKHYNGGMVLDNISLAIEEGKTTVIIGPSGCGKT